MMPFSLKLTTQTGQGEYVLELQKIEESFQFTNTNPAHFSG